MSSSGFPRDYEALAVALGVPVKEAIAGRVKQILRTIYKVNRTTMGWAMTRTENAEAVVPPL